MYNDDSDGDSDVDDRDLAPPMNRYLDCRKVQHLRNNGHNLRDIYRHKTVWHTDPTLTASELARFGNTYIRKVMDKIMNMQAAAVHKLLTIGPSNGLSLEEQLEEIQSVIGRTIDAYSSGLTEITLDISRILRPNRARRQPVLLLLKDAISETRYHIEDVEQALFGFDIHELLGQMRRRIDPFGVTPN